MKKINFISMLLVAMFCILWTGSAYAQDQILLSEGFENDDFASKWEIQNGASGYSASTGRYTNTTSYSHSGSCNFRFVYNTNPPQYLISKTEITVPNEATSVIISLYYRAMNYNAESFQVGYSTTTNDIEAFTWLTEVTGITNTSYTEYTDNTLPKATKYIAIKYTANDKYYLFIDDIEVSYEKPVTCPMPTELSYSDLSSSSVQLAWTNGGTEEAWNVSYKAGSADWNTIAVTTNPYTMVVEPETSYQVKVQAVCGENDESKFSNIASFTTPCGARSLPFEENFSSALSSCWTKVDCESGTTVESGKFKFKWNTNPPQYLITPELNTDGKEVTVEFNYWIASSTFPETFQVGYSTTTTDVSAFTYEDEVTATNTSSTTPSSYSTTFPAEVKYVAIKYNSNDKSALYIDDLRIAAVPTCLVPTALAASSVTANSATLSWTEGKAGDDAWIVEYSTTSDFSNDVHSFNVTATSKELSELEAQTTYYARVKTDCGANGESEYSETISFTTACSAKNAPWSTDFEDENANVVPACWSNAGSTATTSTTYGAPAEAIWAVYNYSGNKSLRMCNAYANSGVAQVTSPIIVLPASPAYELKFDYAHTATCGNFKVQISTDGGESFTDLGEYGPTIASPSSYDGGSNPQTFKVDEVISLAAYSGNIVLRFVVNANYDGGAIFVDNVAVREAPSCVKPVLAEATDITPEGATFAWTAGSDETQYDYCVVASGEAADGWITLDENVRTVTVTGKNAGTTYDFYVRSNCGGVNGVSEAVKASFTPVIDAPTAVTITAISNNGATASWTAAANITTYQYCLVEAGEAATWDQNIDGVTVALSGLNANTEYDFYVRSFYAATSAVAAAEKVTFTTLCDPITVSTEAYEEHFDAFPACWDNKEGTTTNPSYRWSSYSGGKEGYGLRFNSYDNSYKTNILASPVFVLNADADLTFWAKNPKGGDYKVQIAVDGGARADLLTGMTNITAWTKKEASLAAYQGHSIQFFFCATSNDGSGDAYLYLDELAITPQSCRKPATLNEATALTSDGATFTWTAGGTATDYQYAVVEAGQTPVWDAANVVSELNVSLTGLESATSYDFYVRTYCDELNQSEPRQVTFKTTCGVYTGSYEESFTNTLPDCWTATEAAYTWAPYNQTGSNYCLRFDSYMNSNGNQAALTTAQFKLDEDVALKFLCKNKDGGPFKVDMYVVEDAATIELFGDLTGIANWEEKTYNLSDYAGKTVYFTFYGTSNEAPYSAGVDAYMYIDDFRLVRNLSLADNTDNTSLLAANTGKTLDVQINRTFVCADYYNTLCLPFDLPTLDGTPLEGGELWAFKYATVDQTSDELLFRIIEAESIEAGVPYLIAWPAGDNIVNPTFKNVTISATTGQNIGDASVAQLCGIIEKPVVFAAHDETKLFLAENNTLYWWDGDDASQLNNFRAYFLVNTNSGANNAPRHGMRARIIKEEQVITGVEEITNDELRMTNKILRNGQLLIIHNGNIINVLGQTVR